MFKFFKPQSNPATTGSMVGGGISAYQLSGYINELFPHVEAPAIQSNESFIQYRKIFIYNDYENESQSTRVWLDAEQHRGQIAVALDLVGTGSIPNGITEPSNISDWANPSNYANGLDLGTIPSQSYSGIWIRQTLNSITTPDPYASLRLYVGGLVE